MANFPVDIKNIDSINSTILREGSNNGIEIMGTGIIPTATNVQFSYVTLLSCTEIMIIDSISLSMYGSYGALQLQFSSGMENSITGSQIFRTMLNNNNINIKTNKIMSPASAIALNGWYGDNTTNTRAIAYLSGNRITADLNFNANKVILWIGDSITRGSSLGGSSLVGGGGSGSNLQTAVKPTDHFAFQVRNNFQTRGIDCRLVIKAMGGYNSIDIQSIMNEGILDIQKADLIFYQIGTNDAIAGSGVVSDALFSANLDSVINFKLRKFPNSKLIFIGPTPLNNSTYETRLAQLRTIIASKASAINNIYYISLESVFDRNILTNYNASDGIHPNIANNILMSNYINSWVSTNNFTF